MAINDYHFITHWRVRSSPEEISAILRDATDLPRWWPSVYLAITPVAPGDATGVGYTCDLYTKGWLPYTLRWRMATVAQKHPHGFTIAATGDFVGRGEWTIAADGDWVDITYDWAIRADKPLLNYGAVVMKPIFSRNHHWAMAQGLESLELELARRHASSAADRAAVPPPPGPTPVGTTRWLGWLLRSHPGERTRAPARGD